MSYGGYGPGGNDPFAGVGPGNGAPGYGAPGYGAPGQGQPFPPQGPQGYGGQGSGYGQQPGPYGPYGQLGPGGPDEPENENRIFGLLAIGLGLIGFVLAFVAPIYILGAVLAAIGVVFGFASIAKEPTAKGFAVTGLIAGCAGLVVAFVQMILGFIIER